MASGFDVMGFADPKFLKRSAAAFSLYTVGGLILILPV
jgi:hypothetical protein